jgi:hypothetical protein
LTQIFHWDKSPPARSLFLGRFGQTPATPFLFLLFSTGEINSLQDAVVKLATRLTLMVPRLCFTQLSRTENWKRKL